MIKEIKTFLCHKKLIGRLVSMKNLFAVLLLVVFSCSFAFAAETEVSYEVNGQKVLGTLSMPEKDGKVPAVLLLHGFTATRNESKSEAIPEGLFGRMAHELARQGIASLRIDMRGSGKSEGSFEDLTVESEIEDALAGVAYLNQLDTIDKDRISVMGLSLGGIVTTAVAGRSTYPIRSVVLWNPGINPPAAFITMFGKDNVQNPTKDKDSVYVVPFNGQELAMKGDFYLSLFRVVPAAELAKYSGPVLLAIGVKDDIVWPQPTSGAALLSYHDGKHELFTKDAGHVWDDDKGPATADEVIKKSVQFIIENN